MTAKPPRSSTDALLQNNYASAASKHSGKVGAYVRVDADRVGATMGDLPGGRNVHMAPGDLNLHNTGAKFGYR